MRLRSEMKGHQQMIARLRSIADKHPEVVGAAIYQEAQIEMTESKRRVPVDTGNLRSTGMVSAPVYSGRTISVTMSYGDTATHYAIYVHEDLEAFHDDGEAKYLESVLNESAPHMAERIARRVHFNTGGY